jgi:MerR family transcriptional regulator, copper efflux regulator
VKQLLELRLDPRRSCSEVKAEAESKIAAIDARIASLRNLRKSLMLLSSSCSGEGPTSACPILDTIDSDGRSLG